MSLIQSKLSQPEGRAVGYSLIYLCHIRPSLTGVKELSVVVCGVLYNDMLDTDILVIIYN